MPEVKLVNVSKRYGRIVAVDGVNLHVYDKEYVTLLGPSGCGKTTTLRIIAGLAKPDEGEIYIGDRLVNDLPPEDRDIGFVFQNYALFPHMDIWNNVTYGPMVKSWEEEATAKVGGEMLKMVRLYERAESAPHELSGGMMQRVALARALATGSKLLLLDEPLGALDAKIRFELRYELRRLVKDLELTAIHVTHDQEEAMAISDRIVVMKRGKILQVGTPQELYMNPKHLFVANFIGEANFFEGYVREVDEKRITIELRGGLTIRSSDRGQNKGARVVVAVRPEVFVVEKRLKNGMNKIQGSIERITYEGKNIRYEVRLENQDVVVTSQPAFRGEWFKVGERVMVGFPPDKSFIFNYPEKGLRDELELE